MNSIFGDITFKGTWRPYQKRVLDDLNEHLLDKKLHVVAAPGSGKTLLGLEVLLRLNKKTLILAPTITIREQWIERFKTFFNGNDNQITSDLKNPKLITVSTYQAVHAAMNQLVEEEVISDEEKEMLDFQTFQLIKVLKETKIETIILDEAHHLRSEWWKSLTQVIEQLGKVFIVSLTATPPYDVSSFEWQKYKDLCGDIDAEIYVPELVSDHNLCPHQDYVYFNDPTSEEMNIILDYKRNVREIMKYVCENERFIEAIKTHPYIKDGEKYIDSILNAPEYYTSLLIFLKHVGEFVSKEAIKILGHQSKLPPLSLSSMEVLLRGCLYTDTDQYVKYNETINDIRSLLSQNGCIENKTVQLVNNQKLNKLLMNSLGKLNSIKEIVRTEISALHDELRMVILTDFIRKSSLPKSKDDVVNINLLGVVPIFETLRRESITDVKLGVLSGTFIIIPKASVSKLKEVIKKYGILPEKIKLKDLEVDENYCELEIVGEKNKLKVNIVSELFSSGNINVLIGTKSLLGEGWDEPTINSLILASFVGSYMLSNQMRGRAIRVDKNNPNKTANIWHLVCIDPQEKTNIDLVSNILDVNQEVLHSEDFETMKRRFKGFVGVSYTEDTIENGLDRLTYIHPPFSKKHILKINEEMKDLSRKRDELREKWYRISEQAINPQMIEEVTTDKMIVPKKYLYIDTISILFMQLSILIFYFLLLTVPKFIQYSTGALYAFLFVANILLMPLTIKAIFLLIRFGSLKNSLKQIGKALMDTLIYLDIIKSDYPKVVVDKHDRSMSSVHLENATSFEKKLFNDCMEELLGVIDNPRYLLERKSLLLGKFNRRDYLAVPAIIGKNKEGATFLSKRFEKRVGKNTLIYTRDSKGRKLLLYARINSLSYRSLSRLERKRVYKGKWK